MDKSGNIVKQQKIWRWITLNSYGMLATILLNISCIYVEYPINLYFISWGVIYVLLLFRTGLLYMVPMPNFKWQYQKFVSTLLAIIFTGYIIFIFAISK